MQVMKVIPDVGEEYHVVVNTRDILKWERGNPGKSLREVEATGSMADLYALTHIAAKRLRLFSGTLSEFEESVDIEGVAVETPFPTQKAASAGS